MSASGRLNIYIYIYPECVRLFAKRWKLSITEYEVARRATEWHKVVVDGRSRKRLFSSCHDRVAARAHSESKVGEQVDSSQSNRAFSLVGNQRHESSVKVTKKLRTR